MAGEAEKHAMMATHVPASAEELDRWLLAAESGDAFVAVTAVPRLISEVILLRSLAKQERGQAEEARASARAEGYKHQRAEGTRDRLAAELGEALSREAGLKARVEQLEAALRVASERERDADGALEVLRRVRLEASLPPDSPEPSLILWVRERAGAAAPTVTCDLLRQPHGLNHHPCSSPMRDPYGSTP